MRHGKNVFARLCKTCKTELPETYKNYCSQKCVGKARKAYRVRLMQKYKCAPSNLVTAQHAKAFSSIISKLTERYGRFQEYRMLRYLDKYRPDLCKVFINLNARKFTQRKKIATGEILASNCPVCDRIIKVFSQKSVYCSPKCGALAKATQEKKAATHLRRYGSDGSKKQAERKRAMMLRAQKLHDYQLGDRLVKLQGFEGKALQHLLLLGISPKAIVVGVENCPIIPYMVESREHHYFPDIWIPTKNLLIEVKSAQTLAGTEKAFALNCTKAKASIKAGFKFQLFCMRNDGTRVQLPKQWFTMDFERVRLLAGA